tara:strand:- start:132249 stop:132932 length:684 start_codon:yes stop_codon:yes gene_type:complete
MKTLITAEYVKKLHRDGGTSLAIVLRSTIITPEARDVAKALGVEFTERPAESAAGVVAGDAATAGQAQAIRRAVEAKLPPGKHDSALLDQLVQKALRELQHADSGPYCERQVSDSGIVLVRGGSVKFGRFDGAPNQDIGLTDVIGSADKSSIAAGFMQWEKSRFPWTLNYDEIDVVLEGELHITCGGKTSVGKPGDVMLIPKGSSVEFSSPGKVRFVYITYPADWAG